MKKEYGILHQEYIIPQEFIKTGGKYVIYGFGVIGKSFCRDLQLNEDVELVGVLDKKADKFQDEKYSLYFPEYVTELVFDYIIISLENYDIANEIKELLLSYGIDEERILWDGQRYLNKEYLDNYYKNMYQFIRFNSQINNSKRRFYLFMLPEHGNIGDYAIGYSEINFLKKYFPDTSLVCVTSNQWTQLKEEFLKMIHEQDVIFLNGGGYLGSLWGNNIYYEELLSHFPNNIKIFFPNNFTYRQEISIENKELMQGIAWMQNQRNLHIFFRAKTSYDFAKKFCENVYYYPDMVLNLSFPNNRKPDKKVLLCFREDREKLFQNKERLKEILSDKKMVYDEWDINLQRFVPQADGIEIVKDIIKKIQKYELVITDRLHGMILAVVGGVPVIAFDNSTHKVVEVYKWIENLGTVSCLNNEDIEDISEEISKLLLNQERGYNPLEDEFNKMSEVIRAIIKE